MFPSRINMKQHNKYEKLPQDLDLSFQENFIGSSSSNTDYEVSTDILDDVDIGDDDEDEIILTTAAVQAAAAAAVAVAQQEQQQQQHRSATSIAANGLGSDSLIQVSSRITLPTYTLNRFIELVQQVAVILRHFFLTWGEK